jgi:FKBP-type peptidyl-prolyl cis-trans isomerase (trigger factor)
MTRDEIEQKMDELARKYVETQAPEVREEFYKLAKQLEEMEKA